MFKCIAYDHRILYNSREKVGERVRNRQGMWGARRVLLAQFSVALLIAIIAAWAKGTSAAYSAVLGGLVCVVPNAYFARALFLHSGARAAKQIVNGFYRGEALKLMLSAALFTLVFKCFKVDPLVFFVAYMAAQMMVWFAPFIVVNKHK